MTDATQAFYRLAYNREGSDCSVRALAVATATPYEQAHAAMHFAGRAPEQSATFEQMRIAAQCLGYVMNEVMVQSKTMRTLCRELADEPGAFIAITCDHTAGFWEGECIDWSRDRLLRIAGVYRVMSNGTVFAERKRSGDRNYFRDYVKTATLMLPTVLL